MVSAPGSTALLRVPLGAQAWDEGAVSVRYNFVNNPASVGMVVLVRREGGAGGGNLDEGEEMPTPRVSNGLDAPRCGSSETA